MAVDLNKISALLTETFEQPWTEAVVRDNFFFNRFTRRQATGAELRWKIHYAGNQSAGPYSENDMIPEPGMQSYADARVPFKQNWVVVEVTGLAQAATRGRGGYMEVLGNETKEALEDLKDRMNDQIMASTADINGRAIHGIGYIVSNVGVYAGINRATSTWFGSVVSAFGGVARGLTTFTMQQVMAELEKPERKAKTSIIVGNRVHYYQYGNTLQANRRYVSETTLDGGYMALEFEGMPFVSVPALPAGVVYLLDESEFGYYVLENFQTKPKSTNKDSDRFIITHYSNLICKNPGKQAKIIDLSTTFTATGA
jgi:hypothetical protein